MYNPDKCYTGYTLFCQSQEDPTQEDPAHVYLIDMNGKVVHEWNIFTAVQLPQLLPNGNLLYTTRDRSNQSQAGLREIDPDNKVVWCFPCWIDHDFHAMDNEHIMIHCIEDKHVSEVGPGVKRCPKILEVTREKEIVWQWQGEDHLEELVKLVNLKLPLNKFDWAHNNTCEVIGDNSAGRKDSRFRTGNILFSYRTLDIIGIIDKDTNKIVWAWGPGKLDKQHMPTMLENGRIMIFDNGTKRKYSRIIELDPLKEEIVWEYVGKPRERFFSPAISGAERLPNGNTFICEGGPARLFEVTPDKEIVWEYRSPYKKGYEYCIKEGKKTFSLYRAMRYSPEFVKPLLERMEKC